MARVGHLLRDHEQLRPVAPAVSNERRLMVHDATSLIEALALLILFAVTSIHIGVDGHEGSAANERGQTLIDSNADI